MRWTVPLMLSDTKTNNNKHHKISPPSANQNPDLLHPHFSHPNPITVNLLPTNHIITWPIRKSEAMACSPQTTSASRTESQWNKVSLYEQRWLPHGTVLNVDIKQLLFLLGLRCDLAVLYFQTELEYKTETLKAHFFSDILKSVCLGHQPLSHQTFWLDIVGKA